MEKAQERHGGSWMVLKARRIVMGGRVGRAFQAEGTEDKGPEVGVCLIY